MHASVTSSPSKELITLLSSILLSTEGSNVQKLISNLSRNNFDDLVSLANSHHVVVRGIRLFHEAARNAQDDLRAEWAAGALAQEQARIDHAIPFLDEVCAAFEKEAYDITVIKSLDHWPDLGSDLDLYTNAKPENVIRIMTRHFDAQIAPRSWGDRLANKWNFMLPGLPELIEIHVGRLGQTGEQSVIASRVARRSRLVKVGNYMFRVTSASERVMISTLQRMYRHFYFRLCDIVDTAILAESGGIDYDDLRHSAMTAGIWEGVATYLVIVSDYVERYRREGLQLPRFVRDAARFGADQVYFARGFLRVPIMPQSAALYGSQLAALLRKRELHNSARLGLLPWLATAAAVGQKITGSDKGIW
jgi:hypothetical protein